VRGYNSYGAGEWSTVKAVVVTPPPYAPTLNDISEPDDEGNYTVSWSYGYSYPPVDSYTLQEATDANFSSPAEYYPGTSTSQAIYGKEPGTYYYRVRGHNVSGPGEWSAVKSVSVRSYSYYYDFNSSTKIVNPWPIRRTSYWEGDVKTKATWTEEHDGTIYIVMDDRYDFSIASPMEVAPAPPYVIETRVKIHDPANLVAYGIIFGGNGGSPCPAYRDTGCFNHYYRLEAINHGKLKVGLKRIDYHEPESSDSRGKGRGKELIAYKDISGDGDDWNTWRIVVKSDGIKIYVGGDLWGSTDDDKYVNEPYFGIYASANEYKPAIGRYDYYYVTPD
jgi:hypothetical protein